MGQVISLKMNRAEFLPWVHMMLILSQTITFFKGGNALDVFMVSMVPLKE